MTLHRLPFCYASRGRTEAHNRRSMSSQRAVWVVGLSTLALVLAGLTCHRRNPAPVAVDSLPLRESDADEGILGQAVAPPEPVAEARVGEAANEPSSPMEALGQAGEALGQAGTELRGRVLALESRRALPGASVRIGSGDSATTLTTDESGAFRFRVPAETKFIRIHATAPGRAGAETWWRHAMPADPVLLLSSGATLTGRVVDEEGRGVPSATVLAWCGEARLVDRPADRNATCSSDGSFTLEHVGDAFILTAEAEGLACLEGLRGEVAFGETFSGAEVVMTFARELAVEVVDPEGQPVEGARIRVDGSNSTRPSDTTHLPGVFRCRPHWGKETTLADGRARLSGLPVAQITVEVEHEAYLSRDAFIQSDQREVRVQLQRGLSVRGRILGSDGSSARNALVKLVGPRGGGRTRTDAEGLFSLSGLRPDADAHLLVHAAGNALHAISGLEVGPDTPGFLDVRLRPGLVLAGQVILADGSPAAGASLSIEGPVVINDGNVHTQRQTLERRLDRSDTRADAEGLFRFDDLYPGTFEIRASPAGQPELHTQVQAEAGSTHLMIQMDTEAMRGVTFVGRVVDHLTNEPVVPFTATAVILDATGLRLGRPQSFGDMDGSFRLDDCQPGGIELTVSAKGYAAWTAGEREYEEGEYELEVRLLRARSLAFKLRDRAGRPAASALRAHFEDREGRRLTISFGLGNIDALDLGEETVVAGGLPASVVFLVVTSPQTDEQWMFTVDLTQPERRELEFVLDTDFTSAEVPGRAQQATDTD